MARVTLNSQSIKRAAPAAGQIELWDTTTPGFLLRISAGGSRKYMVMRRRGEGGPLVRRTIGNAQKGDSPKGDELGLVEARKRARAMLSDLEAGKDPLEVARAEKAGAEQAERKAAEEAQRARSNTFGALAALYFADTGSRGGAQRRTRLELERKVRVDLAEWSERPVIEITRAEIRALLRRKAATSPVSADRLRSMIRRLFRWGLEEDLIDVSPAESIPALTKEVARERVLSLAEIALIWGACDRLGKPDADADEKPKAFPGYPFAPLVQLLVLTAARRGEIAGMAWSEIEGANWRLPDSRSKTGSGHLVPLSPAAVTIIEGLPRFSGCDLLFSGGRKRPPSAWSGAKRRIDRLIVAAVGKESGEEPDSAKHGLQPWTLHDLRRSAATHLRDDEIMGADAVDRLLVSKILGHAEGGLTKIYDRFSADRQQRAALEAWAAVVGRAVGLNVVPLKGAAA
jgi:integrase